MQHPEFAELVAKAVKTAGSKSELARRIGISPQRLNDYMSGLVPPPPNKVALIAAEANLPADQWLTRATLWKHEGTEEGFRLQQALGKSMRAIGAALALCIAVALAGHFDKPETAFS